MCFGILKKVEAAMMRAGDTLPIPSIWAIDSQIVKI